MKITSLDEYRSAETVRLLTHALARAKAGELEGLALCVRPRRGPEEVVFSDLYRREPAKAAQASLAMSAQLDELRQERLRRRS